MRSAITLVLLLLPLLSSMTYAKERALLFCSSEGDGWKSELSIAETGKAFLRVRKGNGPVSDCELKIRKFEYEPEAIVPRLEFEFDRMPCAPKLASGLEKELRPLSDFTLDLLDRKPKEKLIGRHHWLTFSQSDQCTVKAYDPSGIRLAHERWKRKLWPN